MDAVDAHLVPTVLNTRKPQVLVMKVDRGALTAVRALFPYRRDSRMVQCSATSETTKATPILLLLVGPKGTGKTTVLTHLAALTKGAHFTPSEKHFLQAKDEQGGSNATADIYQHNEGTTWVDVAYALIAQDIEKAAVQGKHLILCESTGTPSQFAPFVQAMRTQWGDANVRNNR